MAAIVLLVISRWTPGQGPGVGRGGWGPVDGCNCFSLRSPELGSLMVSTWEGGAGGAGKLVGRRPGGVKSKPMPASAGLSTGPAQPQICVQVGYSKIPKKHWDALNGCCSIHLHTLQRSLTLFTEISSTDGLAMWSPHRSVATSLAQNVEQ